MMENWKNGRWKIGSEYQVEVDLFRRLFHNGELEEWHGGKLEGLSCRGGSIPPTGYNGELEEWKVENWIRVPGRGRSIPPAGFAPNQL